MKSISLEKRETYEFGGFRLDVTERTIERVDGLRIDTLPEKTLQILALLVSRPGHLVTKDEILEQIWPDSFVEQNNVEKRVHQLRQFLGKIETGGNFIETVRGQGYRFVERVNVVEVSGTWLPETFRIPVEDKQPTEGNGHNAATNGSGLNVERANGNKKPADTVRFSRNGVIACCAAATVVITLVVGYFGFVRTGPARTPRSIAILPANPINAGERSYIYESGIPDALINRLASSEGLKVRPLSSVRDYVGQKVDPIAAGREQKVDYVLESNYQIVDGRIKITALLYNVASGNVEDTFRSEQRLTNLLGAQDAIAADFGNQLMSRFGAKPGGPLAKRGTDNTEAYRLYQQAMYLVDRRRPENSKKGLEYLQQAVALDSHYAQAWAGIALAVRHSGRSDATQIHQEMIEAANKALAIDANVSDAYSALCYDKLHYAYDFAGAESACKQAVQVDPNSSTAHRAYCWVLRYSGHYDEAIAEIRAAIDLEPASYVNQRDYGYALYRAGQFDDAAAQWKRLMDLDPSDPVPYNQLIRTFQAQAKEAEAFEWFIKALTLRQSGAEAIERYTSIYQASGWRGVLLERAADPQNGLGGGSEFSVATLYAHAGENDKAFEHLEKSFQQREWNFAGLLESPELDSLRNDPRYLDLVSRIERK